jgi:hypothetical protein
VGGVASRPASVAHPDASSLPASVVSIAGAVAAAPQALLSLEVECAVAETHLVEVFAAVGLVRDGSAPDDYSAELMADDQSLLAAQLDGLAPAWHSARADSEWDGSAPADYSAALMADDSNCCSVMIILVSFYILTIDMPLSRFIIYYKSDI